MKNEILEIYWAPATFDPKLESWNMLYPEPESVFAKIVSNNKHDGEFTQCPATKSLLKNTFALTSSIEDKFKLNPEELSAKAYTDTRLEYIDCGDAKLGIFKERKSSYDGYINVGYNLRWFFFSSEPVEAKLTAPYFPAFSPVNGALLSPGKFDIGQWFRSINIDMHIPITSESFEIKSGDPIAFLEIVTDKKVVLKRFVPTKALKQIALESVESPLRYGRYMSLSERYAMAKKSKTIDIIKKEIINNLVL